MPVSVSLLLLFVLVYLSALSCLCQLQAVSDNHEATASAVLIASNNNGAQQMLNKPAAGEKCYILALSGGGDKAAYEVGVLLGLLRSMPLDELRWNAISGISAGSNIAAFMSQFARGDERRMILDLSNYALRTRKKNVYRSWKGGILVGALFKSGLMDNQPLREWLTQALNGPNSPPTTKTRPVFIGSTNLETGELIVFNSQHLTKQQLIESVLASSAIPGIFPPVHLNGMTLIDGGVRYGIDVFSVIDHCLKAGFNEDDIVLDTIATWTRDLRSDYEADKQKTLQVYQRSQHILAYSAAMLALSQVKSIFPRITHRFQIFPQQPLKGNAISFDSQHTQDIFKQGQSEGKQAAQQWQLQQQQQQEQLQERQSEQSPLHEVYGSI